MLNHSADPSHNRSVFTMAGDRPGLKTAVLAMAWWAVRTIDMRSHQGAHPRVGAVDVVPFIPLGDTSMSECVELAREVGAAIAERLNGSRLSVRRGGAPRGAPPPRGHPPRPIRRAGGKDEEADWAPDFGPSAPHPTAGATVSEHVEH
jgi:glutamate formiminotransferase